LHRQQRGAREQIERDRHGNRVSRQAKYERAVWQAREDGRFAGTQGDAFEKNLGVELFQGRLGDVVNAHRDAARSHDHVALLRGFPELVFQN
jgi:hypothetical protein